MEDSENIWTQMSATIDALESDYQDSLSFLRNKNSESSDEEIALATTSATLQRFREAVISASEMIATCTTMLALCEPSQHGLDFIQKYASMDEESRGIMEAILIMINMAILDIENGGIDEC